MQEQIGCSKAGCSIPREEALERFVDEDCKGDCGHYWICKKLKEDGDVGLREEGNSRA